MSSSSIQFLLRLRPLSMSVTQNRKQRKCFLFSRHSSIAYVRMNHSSSIWKDEMQSSFLRRYLTYIFIAASNWHDKRVTASGWHFSHPSCHWKHNAFAMCLFFRHQRAEPVLGTCKQSSCMLFAFVCGASSVAQELRSGSNNDELVFFI